MAMAQRRVGKMRCSAFLFLHFAISPFRSISTYVQLYVGLRKLKCRARELEKEEAADDTTYCIGTAWYGSGIAVHDGRNYSQ